MESNFRKQIEEDIYDYQSKFPEVANIKKTEWAFNFWVLDKLYSQDEQIIENNIIDYSDCGIDCFVWHEEQKDLFLIQNKYFHDKSKLTLDYVQNNFLMRPLTALKQGTYTRSKELQNIYTKYSVDSNFLLHLILYVTNNTCKTQEIMKALQSFNQNHVNECAAIYDLDDIKNLYYREPIMAKKTMTYRLPTPNKGTYLSANTSSYKLPLLIDARYIMTQVYNIYKLYQKAKEEGYPIFDSNIREYLGSSGAVNKKIRDTLLNMDDRKNFFYYNNGITVIAKSFKDCGTTKGKFRTLEIQDPQIVNGCQTVSTINEVLSALPEETLEKDFKNTFVMLKVLVIPDDKNEAMIDLRKNIVTYNNSQNSINQKTFEANSDEFKRLQREFRDRGLLICIKQSDKYKYTKEKYKKATGLLNSNKELMKKYGMAHLKNTKDFLIELEKLLQVILAFISTAQDAIQNKSKLLVPDKEQNRKVIDFIKRNDVTINDIIALWMLYIRSDYERRNGESKKIPMPLYVIHCFSKYECNGDPSKISSILSDSEKINNLIDVYTATFTTYVEDWHSKNSSLGYNNMIKSQIDYPLMEHSRKTALTLIEQLKKYALTKS